MATPPTDVAPASSRPALAVVLATDCFATIRPVIAALRRQEVRSRIELVLVAPPGGLSDMEATQVADFAAV